MTDIAKYLVWAPQNSASRPTAPGEGINTWSTSWYVRLSVFPHLGSGSQPSHFGELQLQVIDI